jgi:hypothetical protein
MAVYLFGYTISNVQRRVQKGLTGRCDPLLQISLDTHFVGVGAEAPIGNRAIDPSISAEKK